MLGWVHQVVVGVTVSGCGEITRVRTGVLAVVVGTDTCQPQVHNFVNPNPLATQGERMDECGGATGVDGVPAGDSRSGWSATRFGGGPPAQILFPRSRPEAESCLLLPEEDRVPA